MEEEEEAPVSKRESHFSAQRASIANTASSPSVPRSRRGTIAEASGSGTREYDVPEGWANLNEISAPSPIQNPTERDLYRHRSLEEHVERRRSSVRSTWLSPEQRRSTSYGATEAGDAERAIQRERSRSRVQRRMSRPIIEDEYTMPEEYENLNELAGPSPIENPLEAELYRHRTLEDEREESRLRKRSRAASRSKSRSKSRRISKFREKSVDNLESAGAPEAAIDGGRMSPDEDVEQARPQQEPFGPSPRRQAASRFATQLYTLCYLILFSILGTLVRLGIQWLTFYPGAPVDTPVLWANFAGSMFMGFLSEDRRLFRQEWGSNTSFGSTTEKFQTPNYAGNSKATDSNGTDDGPLGGQNTPSGDDAIESIQAMDSGRGIFDSEQMAKDHAKIKKTIPLYIGLATGFCGSLTSFSSFLRDAFLALANNLPSPNSHPYPSGSAIPATTSTIHRNGGYSFMALLSVVFMTVIMSMGALKIGAHVAIALDPLTPTLSFRLLRKALDRLVVPVALGAWLGAVLLAVWPPDRFANHPERWRGEAIMACVFAPLGCLLRFYASLRLNGVSPAFPLGTFAVNVFGSAVLAMCYDLQHLTFQGVAGGSFVGCQVLEGVMDGFCGCLTTVSTWVAELNGLRRTHSYVYGSSSVLAGLSMMVLIMGSVRWSQGWVEPVCAT